jgi:hypothetical protein
LGAIAINYTSEIVFFARQLFFFFFVILTLVSCTECVHFRDGLGSLSTI